MKSRVLMIAIALSLGVGLTAVTLTVGCSKSAQSQAGAAKYHCPMHPTVVSDKPGDCPICGMRLVPMDDKKHEAAAATSAAEATSASAAPAKPTKKIMYRSTMNPNEVSDKPGKDSMGMDMVAFEVTEGGEQSTVKGLAAVSITPAARERMGLTLGTVEKRPLAREVRTSAKIVADETRLYRVTTKIEGWVDKLFVNITGQEVKKGDPLLTIYSPELVSAEQEYLTLLHMVKQLAQGKDDTALRGAASLLDSSLRRLQFWDISDDQIKQLEQTGKVEKNLTLYSPASGWVTEKNILAGQKIMPGDPLLVVADLSNVWGDADIYQSDLPYVKVGMPVELTLPYWLDKTFEGEVFFVSPTLDPGTRTLKARITIPNPDLLLKPEMYANGRLAYEVGEKLAVPKSAVMRTGQRNYAFREGEGGKLVPVEVKLGIRSDGYYEVVSGLKEGDRVVTSANFLVDSESSMKAAIEALAGK